MNHTTIITDTQTIIKDQITTDQDNMNKMNHITVIKDIQTIIKDQITIIQDNVIQIIHIMISTDTQIIIKDRIIIDQDNANRMNHTTIITDTQTIIKDQTTTNQDNMNKMTQMVKPMILKIQTLINQSCNFLKPNQDTCIDIISTGILKRENGIVNLCFKIITGISRNSKAHFRNWLKLSIKSGPKNSVLPTSPS